MKRLHEFDPEAIRRLVNEERWHEPLPEVRRVRPTLVQHALFGGLRVYVVVMAFIVAWAFLRGSFG